MRVWPDVSEAASVPSRAPKTGDLAAQSERLPWPTIVAYCLPTVGTGFMFLLVGLYLMKFSTDVLLRAFIWDGETLAHAGPPELLDRFEWRPRYTGEFFLGDYHGLVATHEAAIAVFSRSTEDGPRVTTVRVESP